MTRNHPPPPSRVKWSAPYYSPSLYRFMICIWVILPRPREWRTGSSMVFNPLSPSINIQILQTDLHTFPLRISWENLIKLPGMFSFVIIFYILTTSSFDNVWALLGENCCWSLLAPKPSEIVFYRLELGIRSRYWAALNTETPDSYTER